MPDFVRAPQLPLMGDQSGGKDAISDRSHLLDAHGIPSRMSLRAMWEQRTAEAGPMKMVLAVGGPLHGRYLPDGPSVLLTAVRDDRWHCLADPWADVLPGPAREPRVISYRRRMLAVPGWVLDTTGLPLHLDVYTTWPDVGFPPDGMILPGCVTGVPGEHEPLERSVRAEPGA